MVPPSESKQKAVSSRPTIIEHAATTHPEVIIPRRPHIRAIPNHIRHQPRAKVPRQVNRIPRLPAPRGADPEDQEKQTQRHQVAGAGVQERVDAEHEHRAVDELAPEHGRARHEGRRVRAEDARAARVEPDGAHAGSALERVDGAAVVAVDDRRARHGAEHLRDEVDGELAPGEAAEDAVGERHGWVEVAA